MISINNITPDNADPVATQELVSDMFTYHNWDDAQIAQGNIVRQALQDAVIAILAMVPPGPDRSTAIRKCREARMDANSAITHGGKY